MLIVLITFENVPLSTQILMSAQAHLNHIYYIQDIQHGSDNPYLDEDTFIEMLDVSLILQFFKGGRVYSMFRVWAFQGIR